MEQWKQYDVNYSRANTYKGRTAFNPYPEEPASAKEKFQLVLSTIMGIIILGCSTIAYAAYLIPYFNFTLIALAVTLMQYGFTLFAIDVPASVHLRWNDNTRRIATCCYVPIIYGFIANNIISFLLYNEEIRRMLTSYAVTLNNYITSYLNLQEHIIYKLTLADQPNVFGVIIFAISIIFLSVAARMLYSFSFTKYGYNFDIRPMLIVATIILSGYASIVYFC